MQSMGVEHVILVAIVIELDVGLAVMRRLDVDGVVEVVGERVSSVDVSEEGWGGACRRHFGR
jgi:hypothetical protein